MTHKECAICSVSFESVHILLNLFDIAALAVVTIGEKASYRSFEIGLSKPLKQSNYIGC